MKKSRILSSLIAVSALIVTGCKQGNLCNTVTTNVTPIVRFTLKDASNHDVLPALTSIQVVPDSIQLKLMATNNYLSLYYGYSGTQVEIFSTEYTRPSGIKDSLVLYVGSSVPDTLIVETGMVSSFRGDECGTVQQPGITRVTLRGQVLVETTTEDALFTIRK